MTSPLLQIRRAALAMMLLIALLADVGYAQLRTLDSRHYRIYTDLETELAEDLALRLDAVYEEYARRLVDFVPHREMQRSEVYLLTKRSDYERLTGGRFPNTGGVFMASRNILAAFLEEQGRDALRRTLQHEAFHQFAHQNISRQLPIWLNEGLAQLFEEGIYANRQLMVGVVPPRRVRQLHEVIRRERIIPFEQVLAMTEHSWAGGRQDLERGEAQYIQAWAMVHFLVFATDESGRPRYRVRFLQMLRRIQSGEDGFAAFTGAFSDNIAGFEARFHEWAAALQPTPLAQYADHQAVLADMLLSLHRSGQRFTELPDFRRHVLDHALRMRYTKASSQWVTAPDPTAYFSDLSGTLLSRDQLTFQRSASDLPDIVCRPMDDWQLRVRFYRIGDAWEHELLYERVR